MNFSQKEHNGMMLLNYPERNWFVHFSTQLTATIEDLESDNESSDLSESSCQNGGWLLMNYQGKKMLARLCLFHFPYPVQICLHPSGTHCSCASLTKIPLSWPTSGKDQITGIYFPVWVFTKLPSAPLPLWRLLSAYSGNSVKCILSNISLKFPIYR